MPIRHENAQDRIHRRRTTILYGWVMRVLAIGFWSSIGLIVFGLLIALVRDQSTGEVLRDALSLNASGLVDLGILVLLLTPGATVVVSLITAVRQKDRFFTATCVILLLIVLGGIGVSLW